MLPRFLEAPTPVIFGAPVHHRANSRCAILLFFCSLSKPFFAEISFFYHCANNFIFLDSQTKTGYITGGMKKIFLSVIFLFSAAGISSAQYGEPTPRQQLSGSYNVLVDDIFPDSEYHRLCKKRLMQLVPLIINGADANVTLAETKGNTALHYAVALGYQDLVYDLLLCGANPNLPNHKGRTPVQCIENDDDGTMFRILRDYNRCTTSPATAPEESPAIRSLRNHLSAITNSNPRSETQQLYRKRLMTLLPLIINGANANITLPETKGNTALHYACGMGNYDLVNMLISLGADPTIRTHKGATPADCATGPNAAAIIRLLRENSYN